MNSGITSGVDFASADKIAAAILYEGYILYPYRPTAIKNRQRWNFGTLYPRIYAESQNPQEPFRLITECLLITEANAQLDVKVSFLQLIRQETPQPAAAITDPSLAWDEAIERSSEHRGLHISEILHETKNLTLDFEVPPNNDVNVKPSPIPRARLSISAETLSDTLVRLHIELQNTTPLNSGAKASRAEALPLSLVSAHLLLGATNSEFVSLLDPPEPLRKKSSACTNIGVFPVLAGNEPDRSIMLCSPIILYDYPKVAPESAGDFFDGTEMDEMLTLRVLTLTDDEKEEMRNSDARARTLLERTEAMTEEAMLKSHGIIRSLRQISDSSDVDMKGIDEWNPFEETKPAPESVRVFGVELRIGDRVRLWPQKKADIIDLALTGQIAIIEAIEQDFEDKIQLAVVLDDDPGREFGMMRQPGHRFFFSPEEVEPLNLASNTADPELSGETS